ncbi:MAG TPA: aryl-sulfate sulfotransferase [Chloroflexota bacterium]|nr:aryl-sulfate sulfotransferase [Chloroflexota bacterium]
MGFSPFRPTGVTYHDPTRAFAGYTLYTPLGGDLTLLIDMAGRVVHVWQPPPPLRPYYGYLLPEGRLLLRCTTGQEPWALGGESGAVVELDWDGQLVWRYDDPTLHHDHCRLRNGNTLLLYWEPLPAAVRLRVQGGQPGTELAGEGMLGDALREVTPDGRTVWEWHAYEALDPAVDVLCPLHPRHEWAHCNAVEELPDGNLVLSFRLLDTVAILDKRRGQFVWKWGRGTVAHQHDPTPLPNGNLLLFDNGMHRVGLPRSRVVEVDPRTNAIVWQYVGTPQASFFSGNISGAQRLPNGNTLICEGACGRLFEVTPDRAIVWEYHTPYAFPYREEVAACAIFRAHRYAADGPELRGRL